MSKLDTAQPPDSPLWRIGLYQCANIDRLQVGPDGALDRVARELDAMAREAGFEVIQSVPVRYSPESEHGYTHTIAIGQSSIVFHTYPEIGTVTISLETCGDYDYCELAARRLGWMSSQFFGATDERFLEGPRLPLVLPKETLARPKRAIDDLENIPVGCN